MARRASITVLLRQEAGAHPWNILWTLNRRGGREFLHQRKGHLSGRGEEAKGFWDEPLRRALAVLKVTFSPLPPKNLIRLL